MIKELIKKMKKNVIKKKILLKKRIHYLRSATITFLFQPAKRIYKRRTSKDNSFDKYNI